MTCPVCARSWRDLARHMAFAHQEDHLLFLDLSPVPAPESEPLWLPLAYLAIGLALLWLVAA